MHVAGDPQVGADLEGISQTVGMIGMELENGVEVGEGEPELEEDEQMLEEDWEGVEDTAHNDGYYR